MSITYFKSGNNGQTWQNGNLPNPTSPGCAFDIGGSGVVYVAFCIRTELAYVDGHELYLTRSYDDGVAWMAHVDRLTICSSMFNDDFGFLMDPDGSLLVMAFDTLGSLVVYKSLDDGENWNLISNIAL